MMKMWSEKPRWGRGTALYASHLLVYTWSSVLFSPDCYGDMLIELRQSVHQFSVIKVPRYHEE